MSKTFKERAKEQNESFGTIESAAMLHENMAEAIDSLLSRVGKLERRMAKSEVATAHAVGVDPITGLDVTPEGDLVPPSDGPETATHTIRGTGYRYRNLNGEWQVLMGGRTRLWKRAPSQSDSDYIPLTPSPEPKAAAVPADEEWVKTVIREHGDADRIFDAVVFGRSILTGPDRGNFVKESQRKLLSYITPLRSDLATAQAKVMELEESNAGYVELWEGWKKLNSEMTVKLTAAHEKVKELEEKLRVAEDMYAKQHKKLEATENLCKKVASELSRLRGQGAEKQLVLTGLSKDALEKVKQVLVSEAEYHAAAAMNEILRNYTDMPPEPSVKIASPSASEGERKLVTCRTCKGGGCEYCRGIGSVPE